ncbi:MmcQ/YjbR family DNA-binding protein [Methylobacterium oryzisoli]|uniref:MmcQ/YjbR family DNA-binding protein n=1 Tax=Methylobacterium oryzisoli TaxID=3385502 RepID=UPI0038915C59
MTWDDVVALSQGLPEVEVSTSYGTPALKVCGKLVTRLRPEDDSLVLPDVPIQEREMLIETNPCIFHVTPHYDGYAIVLARLAVLEPATLLPFLRRRWRAVAPKRLVIRFDATHGRRLDDQL